MEELGNFSYKVNVIANGLKKYINFSINNKLSFIDSFQFLSSSLDSFVKNLEKYDLSQEFDKNVLNLVKKKWSYPSECMNDFEKFKEELPPKQKFYSLLTGKKFI